MVFAAAVKIGPQHFFLVALLVAGVVPASIDNTNVFIIGIVNKCQVTLAAVGRRIASPGRAQNRYWYN